MRSSAKSLHRLGASAAFSLAISHSRFVQFGLTPNAPPHQPNWHPPNLPRARDKPTVSTPGLINYHRLLVDNDRSEQWHAPWRQAEALESAHVLGTTRGRISLQADKKKSGIRANKDTKLRALKDRNGANGYFRSSLTHRRPSISPSSSTSKAWALQKHTTCTVMYVSDSRSISAIGCRCFGRPRPKETTSRGGARPRYILHMLR